MIITISDVVSGVQIKSPWFHKRFTHVQEGYIIGGKSAFNVSKLITEAERQIAAINKSHNQEQTLKSKEMLKKVLEFLKNIEKK
jgi:hypothetical protein